MAKQKMTLDKLAQMTKREFDRVGDRFSKIDERFEKINERFDVIETRLDNLESSLTRQIASLRGDLIVIMRKEDRKLDILIGILKRKNVLSEADIKTISSIRVFPKIEIKT